MSTVNAIDTFRSMTAEGKNPSLADVIAFRNAHKGELTAADDNFIENWVSDRVTHDNVEARAARMNNLLAMDRTAMWKEYTVNPTFDGTIVSVDDSGDYVAESRKINIKFSTFEKHFQTLHSVKKDDSGNPKPNKAVSICRDGHYVAMARILNAYLQMEGATDIGALKLNLSKEKLEKALGDAGEAFAHNNKKNRVTMLHTIIAAMLPEELTVNILSCDISYLKQAIAKVKGRTVTGIGDKAFIDLLIVVIGCALSYDETKKERTMRYEYNAKAGLIAKA